MRMNRRFDSVASLREGVALSSAGAVPEQVREPRIQLLVGHLPHANLRIERELVPVAPGFHLARAPFQGVHEEPVALGFLGSLRLARLARHIEHLFDMHVGLALFRARVARIVAKTLDGHSTTRTWFSNPASPVPCR
jgi:hypothetical protein